MNHSSMNSQSEENEKYDFRFSLKIKDLQSLILAAHPCAAGTSEIIRGSLVINSVLRSSLARLQINLPPDHNLQPEKSALHYRY
jgi:hypothetical protein